MTYKTYITMVKSVMKSLHYYRGVKMKLIKFLPALAAVVTLGSCVSAPAEKAMGNTSAQPTAKNSVKTIVYQCQNKKEIVASYEFAGEKATGVTLTLNNKVVKDLVRNDNPDFAAFESKTHLFNVEKGLTAGTADKTDAAMLFKHTKKSDQILAKDCRVNAEKTAKLQ